MARSVKTENRFVDFDLAFTKNGLQRTLGDSENDTLGYEITIKKDENAIQQAITNLLLTRKGEKAFIPDFGTEIVDLLFENTGDPTTYFKIQNSVAYVGTYEPVKFLDLTIDDSEVDSNNVFLKAYHTLWLVNQENKQNSSGSIHKGKVMSIYSTISSVVICHPTLSSESSGLLTLSSSQIRIGNLEYDDIKQVSLII